jgi:hypothetical protein
MFAGKDVDWKSIMPGMDHLDIRNPEAFEVKDLDRLIKQVSEVTTVSWH